MTWGLLQSAPAAVDVTVAGRDCGQRAGVRLHRVRRLDPADACVRDGLPTTTAARTLLDAAEVTSERELERAVNEALVQRLATEDDLRALLARSAGRRGARLLRRCLDRSEGPTLTRSEAERRLLALLRTGGLPAPETNVDVGGHEVDALWRDRRLVVEIDGYAFHRTRTAFERDRERDADLQALGFRVIRVTWRQIADAPEALLVRIARLLAAS